MKKFVKKYLLAIQLVTIVLIPVIIVSIGRIVEAIDLPTSVSIFAVLIALAILLISINEIRNRLRPWVSVVRIEQELTENPDKFYYHFFITNTGPIPASKIRYTTEWYIQNEGRWEKAKIPEESPFTSSPLMLFPNQSIDHRTEMNVIQTAIGDKDTKVTFVIEYKGLWSKHTTINTHKFDYTRKVWMPDEPQDYT